MPMAPGKHHKDATRTSTRQAMQDPQERSVGVSWATSPLHLHQRTVRLSACRGSPCKWTLVLLQGLLTKSCKSSSVDRTECTQLPPHQGPHALRHEVSSCQLSVLQAYILSKGCFATPTQDSLETLFAKPGSWRRTLP